MQLTPQGVLHFVDNNTELYSLSKYASIFLHPTLKSLTVSCMSTDVPQRLFQNLHNIDVNDFKRSTALETLHLEECDIHPPSLELILGLPRALKSLKISEGIRYDGLFRAGSSRVHGNMKPHPFAEALVKTCKDSLESLSLSLGYFRSHHHNINHSGQHLRLHELENLKHLEVNHRTLNLIRHRPGCDHNTWKRLPQSLETFKVFGVPLMQPPHNAQQPSIPLEPCIVRDKAHHGVPNLKTVIYSYEHYDTVDDDEMNFNDLLMNLVYNNDANGNPPGAGLNANPILNLIQQVADVGNVAPQQQVPVQQPQPVHAPAAPNFITATLNHLDAPPQNIQPPRFRWRTGNRRGSGATELSRGDTAKFSLLNVINDSVLPHFEQTQTRLQIDLVTLPRGFIPPYLFPEDKPRVRESWFDSRKPRTATSFLDSVRRKQARRNAAAQAAAAAYAASSSASSSPSPVDRNLGLGFGMAAVNERIRSRNMFIRRLRQGDLDDELMADDSEMRVDDSSESDSGSDDSTTMDEDEGEDEEMEVDDMLEMLAGEADQSSISFRSETGSNHTASEHMNDDVNTGPDTVSDSSSVYVDAETEVEMTEAESLDSSSASEGEAGDVLLFSTLSNGPRRS